jgi:hypothetical protein
MLLSGTNVAFNGLATKSQSWATPCTRMRQRVAAACGEEAEASVNFSLPRSSNMEEPFQWLLVI